MKWIGILLMAWAVHVSAAVLEWDANSETNLARVSPKESIFRFPSMSKSLSCAVVWNIKPIRECFKTVSDTPYRKPPIGASISHLFALRGPFAISGFVVSEVFLAFNRHSNRALAHIGEEIHKRVAPTVANRNASPAVVLINRGLRISAAFNHSAPDAMCQRSGKTVSSVAFRSSLFLETATRLSVTAI